MLKGLNPEQEALVDFLVLSNSNNFVGLGSSTFSVYLRRAWALEAFPYSSLGAGAAGAPPLALLFLRRSVLASRREGTRRAHDFGGSGEGRRRGQRRQTLGPETQKPQTPRREYRVLLGHPRLADVFVDTSKIGTDALFERCTHFAPLDAAAASSMGLERQV
jgi:hypothetical protein